MGRLDQGLAHLAVVLIQVYRFTFAALLGGRCRFHPSCSVYAVDAVRAHGGLRGGLLALRRLGRCHPWGGAGWDPVPSKNPSADAPATSEAQ